MLSLGLLGCADEASPDDDGGSEAPTTGAETGSATTGSTGDMDPTTEGGASTESGLDESGSGTTSEGPNSALDGVWQTDGYGWVYSVEGDVVHVFEVTGETCMQVVVGTIVDTSGEQTRVDLEVPGLFTLGMSVWPDGDTMRFLADGLIVAPPATNVGALPPVCEGAPDPRPLAVFDTLTSWFDEHYALFDDRDVDWPAAVAQHRERIENAEADLFTVVTDLLAPLEDAHVSLQGPDGAFEGRRIEDEPVTEGMVEQAQALISSDYLVTEREAFVLGQIEFARLPDDVGYLAAHGFGPLVGEDGRLDYLGAVEEFEDALDSLFDGDPMSGLVVDLRTNGGGSDLFGLALARRLASSSHVAYEVRARIDPEDASVFGPTETIMVEPSRRPGFDGPVAVLLGRDTVSAGETAALALRGQPDVTLIGEPSQGAFSSVLNHFLPNGWLLGLPNEHYLTESGERFDVVGIPPDIEVDVFSAEDLGMGRDSALDAALDLFSD